MRISDWSSDVCASDLRSHPSVGSCQPFDFGGGRGGALLLYINLLLIGDEHDCGRTVREFRLILSEQVTVLGLEEHQSRGFFRLEPEFGDASEIVFGFFRSDEHTSELQTIMRTSYPVLCF